MTTKLYAISKTIYGSEEYSDDDIQGIVTNKELFRSVDSLFNLVGQHKILYVYELHYTETFFAELMNSMIHKECSLPPWTACDKRLLYVIKKLGEQDNA